MEFISESLQTPVTGSCGVLVAGGGIAGISAALAAARAGADVILLEREYMLGGLATAGMVTIYLPLDDGMGHQVSFGIAEELLRLSLVNSRENAKAFDPAVWLDKTKTAEERRAAQRFEAQYNPYLFAVECERLLLREGVTILYGTSVCAVEKRGDAIGAVIVENKSGRSAIRVRSVVDCTGDADVCRLAGAETVTFRQGNVLAAWYYFLAHGEKEGQLKTLGSCDTPDAEKAESGEPERLTERRFTGLDARELSEMTILSHEQTFNDVMKMRKTEPDYTLTTMASIPQIRMTRRIAGAFELDIAHDHASFDDCVGRFGNWKKRGPVYELPFRCLYGGRVPNLITAGRCISASETMWDVTRVIPVCAVSGEAAGAAAAMTDDFSSLDVKRLQAHLEARRKALF